jgi:hypothetical protein
MMRELMARPGLVGREPDGRAACTRASILPRPRHRCRDELEGGAVEAAGGPAMAVLGVPVSNQAQDTSLTLIFVSDYNLRSLRRTKESQED